MKITLVRHGRPDVRLRGWIAPAELKAWIRHYNEADVLPEAGLLELRRLADTATVRVSSPYRRCLQSARLLCTDDAPVVDAIFCEAELPYLPWTYPRLPIALWLIVFRLAWLLGFSRNAESLAQARQRAVLAAEKLAELARGGHSVLLLGHGLMNMLIARELIASGWVGPRRPGRGYWQFSTYRLA